MILELTESKHFLPTIFAITQDNAGVYLTRSSYFQFGFMI